MRKKSSFTLIEVSIALFIIGILLSFLFNFFAQIIKVEKKIKITQHDLIEREHFQVKIKNVFSKISSIDIDDQTITMYTPKENEKTLFVIFDNGIDPDPHFSGPILGKFFIKNENFYLQTYPIINNKIIYDSFREEKILSSIFSIKYFFLMENEISQEKDSSEKLTKMLKYTSRYKKGNIFLPPIIKMTIIDKNQKTFNFAFFTPSQSIPITFKKLSKKI